MWEKRENKIQNFKLEESQSARNINILKALCRCGETPKRYKIRGVTGVRTLNLLL